MVGSADRPEHLYVAATSLYEATVTTHHPDEPCAGCAHPDAGPPPEAIPTISFVRFWAGLLQACALLGSEQKHSQPGGSLSTPSPSARPTGGLPLIYAP